MDAWDMDKRQVRAGYPPDIVQEFCVREPSWQIFRLSLKGISTREKLRRLADWYDGEEPRSDKYTKWQREVQVGNYLGALRRGGQLDMQNRFQR